MLSRPHRALLLAALSTLLASAGGDDAFPAATPESQGLSSEALEALAQEAASYVERDLAVGAELLVIKNRRTVLHRWFGQADREGEEPWERGTVCNIRSMTKPLTGAAAQILIDRGQLAPGDPAAEYLPGFDTDEAREITVAQLLAHRAGLPLTILESIEDHETLLDMGNAVGARGPEYAPESRFWYSDSGTDALGAIVEVASGERLDELVRRELLEPLGMSESFYYLDPDDPRRSRIASLYYGGVGNWRRFLDPDEGTFYPYAWGSQSLYSTPRDYARFLALWMDGGRVGEDVVLSPEAIERTLTPISEMTMLGSEARFPTSYRGLEVYYGQMAVLHVPLGSGGEEPATIVGHSGSDGTIAWAWPERDLMILYFTQSRGGGSALRLEEAIDRLLIAPETYAGDDEAVPAELRPYVGTYVSDWLNHMKEDFVVAANGDRFTLDVPSLMKFELVPTGEEGRWCFSISRDVTVWFERDEDGAVDCLRLQQGPMVFEAPRKGTPHARAFAAERRATPETVGKYLGKYDDPDSEAPAEVFIDRDYLAIRTGEGQVFHLWDVPVDDTWRVRESPLVTITFQEDQGIVVSVTRESPGAARAVMERIE
jgi:CubicO group peptidase (beta-lactamase class C family)